MIKTRSDDQVPLTPDKLGELYPTPKTYDEKTEETDERQELFKARRTRLAAFKIALFGSLLFAAIVYYAHTVEILWMMADITTTAFSYAIWLVLFLFAIKWLRYTANIFYEYSSPMLAFWIMYGVLMGFCVFAWQRGLWVGHSDIRWLPILIAAQFIVSYIAAKLFIKRG